MAEEILECVVSFFRQESWPNIGLDVQKLIVGYVCWPFVIGDVVDAKDHLHCWYEATILNIHRSQFKVHYETWYILPLKSTDPELP